LLRGRVEAGDVFGEGAGAAEGLSVEDKLRVLVVERLKMNVDVKGVWQDVRLNLSLALSTLPFNPCLSFFLFFFFVSISTNTIPPRPSPKCPS
jgi:hypothetical protein